MNMQEVLASSELIGLHAKIIESSNKETLGKNGIVIDETKFMFTLNTDTGEKKIPKQNNKWQFDFNDQIVTLDGKSIAKKPQDRWRIKI